MNPKKTKHQNVVFIHINKTGGLSIKKALAVSNPIKKRHLTAIEMKNLLGPVVWETSFKFSFVRNPWDKVVSHYNYRLKRNKHNMKQDNISFKHWVTLAYGEQDTKYYNNQMLFSPQLDWLVNQSGEIDFDFIGRFENIKQDFQKLTNLLNLKTTLPHLNATHRGAYKNYYDCKTREIVRRCFEKDIVYFDYHF